MKRPLLVTMLIFGACIAVGFSMAALNFYMTKGHIEGIHIGALIILAIVILVIAYIVIKRVYYSDEA